MWEMQSEVKARFSAACRVSFEYSLTAFELRWILGRF